MPITPYAVPAETVRHELEIKKSRFITYLAHTPGEEEAKQFIQSLRETYPDARHHCWAFVAGRPESSVQWGCGDDGEPAGTAGKPMLAQLSGANVGEVCAVVVRYFGGIKLGTGGLVKAYGSSVQQALGLLTTREVAVTVPYTISCEYAHIDTIESLLKQHDGVQLDAEFSHNVRLSVRIDARYIDVFLEALKNQTRGQAHAHPLEHKTTSGT
ncbi:MULTISPECIES: YigZ family protein [Salinivibrio]|uniref:YigZ family protein n=1 Tax=Salinivibrio kushneri TaxID=1908198 RepID=A0AB36JTP4_9GAMM|nr:MULTISPECIES: YigZ family protein [Salinivibrio]ODP97259.1 YigZ family protein [Salinivibrio sp. BNH]OOE33145.1 YigZ family protein [Salinivibrio kushneri]OOE33908.1 YigZ family protein [Salinivibrio kushneri]OOE38067.1 YigZ family protein [Salinivibrio kushneri]OOE41865.1 YigZ family protein [Salinivibrio kushneri]